MKSAFKQAIEDIGYGMVIPGDNRFLATANLVGGLTAGFAGLVLRNPLLLGLSAFCFACTAAEYQIHGSNIRRSMETPAPR
jgi:hypothetical protein